MLTNQEIVLEQEILGGIFNNSTLFFRAKEKIKSCMFRIDSHKKIYKGILRMMDEGKSIDTINFLENYKNITKEMGGVSYITEVSTCSISEENFNTKLELLVENYKRSEILKLSKKLCTNISTSDMVEAVENTLASVYKSSLTREVDIISPYENYLDWLYNDTSEIGFKSGLNKLDKLLCNFQRGRLITIFSRSGVGKTTMSLQIALNMAMNGQKIVYCSGEMSNTEVFNKMASSYCYIKYSDISNKVFADEEKKDKVNYLITKLLNNEFYVTNETNIDVLIDEIKLYKLEHGLDVVFVDYINKYVSGAKGSSLTEKLGEVSSKLKTLAMQENICIVLLAQANRGVDRNVSDNLCEKISESDIQDSARIEQDSDQVIALYRNKKLENLAYRDEMSRNGKINYNSRSADENPNCINAIILKNRHGGKGMVGLVCYGEYSRIENMF
ncbi:replicative DNA helicase [Clostridium chauvoei]|uniref:replicative DNA helicase n=1 Tax=Clostridium chauvoei TaxID=46867 RepID=UPI001C84CE62|nr:DnaB-like helicase C-terminal domain-containing protein [Clostridium chauvoei]MBX7404848.1 AAA family ATPase [Clostridium chauvoei]